MRAKKPSAVLASSMLLEVAGQTAMGIALGVGFAFVLTHFPQFGIVAYIDQSFSPRDAMMMLVVTCVTTFRDRRHHDGAGLEQDARHRIALHRPYRSTEQ